MTMHQFSAAYHYGGIVVKKQQNHFLTKYGGMNRGVVVCTIFIHLLSLGECKLSSTQVEWLLYNHKRGVGVASGGGGVCVMHSLTFYPRISM